VVGAKGNPFNAAHFYLLCVPIQFLIIHNLSTKALWQLLAKTSSSEAEESWREINHKFCLRSISSTLVGFWNMLLISRHETDGFTSSTKKSCYEFLLPLKIHYPWRGLNQRIFGPVESTQPLDHRQWQLHYSVYLVKASVSQFPHFAEWQITHKII
jgi:hypothetical protein